MKIYIQQLQQFLAVEKELATDLALDVANPKSDYELAKAKAVYSTQLARISGIEDTLNMALKVAEKA